MRILHRYEVGIDCYFSCVIYLMIKKLKTQFKRARNLPHVTAHVPPLLLSCTSTLCHMSHAQFISLCLVTLQVSSLPAEKKSSIPFRLSLVSSPMVRHFAPCFLFPSPWSALLACALQVDVLELAPPRRGACEFEKRRWSGRTKSGKDR
jgi:hypothetical protein